MDALAAKILAISMDGLTWKTEYKKEPVAYGVFKIVIGAVVEDEKVSTDLVEEAITAFEDEVQSIDIQSFNKLIAFSKSETRFLLSLNEPVYGFLSVNPIL